MRYRPTIALVTLALALAPLTAAGHHRTSHTGGPPAASQGAQPPAQGVGRGGCPRGLASRATPCVPPGQARRSAAVPPVPAG